MACHARRRAISQGRIRQRPHTAPEQAAVKTGRSAWARAAGRFHVTETRLDSLLSGAVFLGFLALLLMTAPGLDYFLTNRDHGYQLCVGTQVLMGKVPGVDIIVAYGPAGGDACSVR